MLLRWDFISCFRLLFEIEHGLIIIHIVRMTNLGFIYTGSKDLENTELFG